MSLRDRIRRLLAPHELHIVDGRNPESILFTVNGCPCAVLARRKLVLGWDVFAEGLEAYGCETLRERTPWVELVRCRHCGRYWHVATDTVDDDVYVEPLTAEAAHLVLTENRWPRTFDHLAHVGLDRAK